MVLHLKEEVIAAEDIGVSVREPAGVFVLIGEDGLGDVAAETGGEADEPFGVLREQVEIDARLVIETVEVGGGDELA